MTMQDNWDEEQVVRPAPILLPPSAEYSVVEEVEVAPEEEEVDEDEAEIRAVAELTDKDREHLFGLSGLLDTGNVVDDDLSDVVDVDSDDIIEGVSDEPPKPRYRIVPKGRRVIRRPPPPSSSMGGVRL